MNLDATVRYGRTTLSAILRRRAALLALLALPLTLYVVTHDAVGRSVRSLLFGLSWALSTLALFASQAARQIEPRLALAGWRTRSLLAARAAGLTAFALALATLLWAVVALDQPVRSVAGVALTFAATAIVAVAVGMAVGGIVRDELQGALILFFFAGLQAVANPFDGYTRFLPFWSSRELATWAIDGPDAASPTTGLAHAGTVVVACAALMITLGIRRARRR